MSSPVGATHALNDMIWGKPEPILEPGQIYTVRVHDTITGQCTHKREFATGQEITEMRRWLSGYKFFVYPITTNP